MRNWHTCITGLPAPLEKEGYIHFGYLLPIAPTLNASLQSVQYVISGNGMATIIFV